MIDNWNISDIAYSIAPREAQRKSTTKTWNEKQGGVAAGIPQNYLSRARDSRKKDLPAGCNVVDVSHPQAPTILDRQNLC